MSAFYERQSAPIDDIDEYFIEIDLEKIVEVFTRSI